MKRAILFLTIVSLLPACGNNDNTSGNANARVNDSTSKSLPSQAQQPASNAAAPDTTQSLATMEKRYAMVPSDPVLAYDLAYEYSEQKNAKALKLADSLIKAKAPEVEKAYYIKANYFSHINNTDQALKNYDAAIGANYHFLDAYFDKGQLLFKQKKYDEALKTFAIGQKVSPATADFYYWVAKTQEAMGNKADAKMNYERAYALDKTLTEAKAAAERL
jgi:tetratricopeptide (TPR) repeat protein